MLCFFAWRSTAQLPDGPQIFPSVVWSFPSANQAAEFFRTASAIVLTLCRITFAAAGSGTFRPKFLSSAAVSLIRAAGIENLQGLKIIPVIAAIAGQKS